MKKGICLITVLCLFLDLSACGAKSDTETSNGVITSKISLPKLDSEAKEQQEADYKGLIKEE